MELRVTINRWTGLALICSMAGVAGVAVMLTNDADPAVQVCERELPRMPMAWQIWEVEGVGSVLVSEVDLSKRTVKYEVRNEKGYWCHDRYINGSLDLFLAYGKVSKANLKNTPLSVPASETGC